MSAAKRSNARKTPVGYRRGDPTKAEMMDRLLRVDQAGEHGAVRIYAGQRAVLKHSRHKQLLKHMYDQEREHKAAFDKLVIERRARPTALSPLWHVFGYALGAGTALMGEKAAMACTVAVEEVIDGHYSRQIDQLGADEAELKAMIEKFRADELEHRDAAYDHGADETRGYLALAAAIKGITRGAIWLSERV